MGTLGRKTGSTSIAIAIAFLLGASTRLLGEETNTNPVVLGPGLVVQDVKTSSPLEKAGLQPGDIILAWKILEANDTDFKMKAGSFNSIFNWRFLIEEVSPGKPIGLSVGRGALNLQLRIEPGLPWETNIRPEWSKTYLDAYQQGRKSMLAGRLEDGTAQWDQLSKDLVALGRDELACWLSIETAQFWRRERQPARAVEILREAAQRPSTSACQAQVQDELGLSLQGAQGHDLAKQSFEQALRLKDSIYGRGLGWAVTHSLLGALAWEKRDLSAAREHWLAALKVQENRAPRSNPMVSSLSNLGVVASFTSRFSEAESYCRKALTLAQELSPQSPMTATILNTLGNVRLHQGDYEGAQALFMEALSIAEQDSSQKLLRIRITNNLGFIALDKGDVDSAGRFFSKALEGWEQLAPGSLEVAIGLSNLGNTFLFRGESELARNSYEKALAIRRRLAPDSLDTAGALNNLSIVASSLEESERYQLEALKIQENIAPESQNTARSLLNLGTRALKRGEYDRARQLLKRGTDMLLRISPYSLDTATGLTELGMLVQPPEKGNELLAQSLALTEKLAPNSEHAIRAAFVLARRMIPTDPGAALDLFESAATKLDEWTANRAHLIAYPEIFERQHERVYKEYIDLLIASKQREKAFHVLERYRARKFLSLLEQRDLLPKEISLEATKKQREMNKQYDLLQRKLASLREDGDQDQAENLMQALRELRFQRAALMAEVKGASPQLAQLSPSKAPNVVSAQSLLEAGTLLLSYSLGEKNSYLFVLSRDGALDAHRLSTNEAEMRQEVQRFLDLVQAVQSGSPLDKTRAKALASMGSRLYRILIAPAEQRIGASQRLFILPDASLHALPWGALVRNSPHPEDAGRDWQFLAEWKPLHLGSSMAIAPRTGQSNPFRGPAAGISAFGAPLYPTQKDLVPEDLRSISIVRRGSPFSPLPGSRRETERIGALFPSSAHIFLGPEATEENAKALPREIGIVHFATHTILDETSPLDSAIVLSVPPNKGNDQENGLLQAWEIFESIRLDSDLVVLSACESGLGKEIGGEGLIGLTRAFQYAGARSVLASLWKISDRTTAELMVRFYRHLKDGKPKDEALRAAQMELIRGPIQVTNEKGEVEEIDASAPYYWAAFQIYGDWQ